MEAMFITQKLKILQKDGKLIVAVLQRIRFSNLRVCKKFALNILYFVCIFFPIMYWRFLQCLALYLRGAPWVSLRAIRPCRKHSKGHNPSTQHAQVMGMIVDVLFPQQAKTFH